MADQAGAAAPVGTPAVDLTELRAEIQAVKALAQKLVDDKAAEMAIEREAKNSLTFKRGTAPGEILITRQVGAISNAAREVLEKTAVGLLEHFEEVTLPFQAGAKVAPPAPPAGDEATIAIKRDVGEVRDALLGDKGLVKQLADLAGRVAATEQHMNIRRSAQDPADATPPAAPAEPVDHLTNPKAFLPSSLLRGVK